MGKLKFLWCILFMVISNWISAQSESNLQFDLKENLQTDTNHWVPTLLNANHSALYQLASFAGFVFGWVPRGQATLSTSLINGVNWQSKNSGWSAPMTYAGLFKIFHQQEFSEQYGYSSKGFEQQAGVNYSNTWAYALKKSIQLGTRLTNNFLVNETTINYSSGKLKQNWHLHAVLVVVKSNVGTVPFGFKNLNGFAISVDKILNRQQKMGFSFWQNGSSQGRQSPSTQEAINLSGKSNYNPNWGWYQGQAYYPSIKQNNTPVLMLYYEKKWEDRASVDLNLGYGWGTQKKGQLDWTKTRDPRPDYYKYLPSYSKDTALQNIWIHWLRMNPSKLQIDFDQIEQINKSSPTGRSFYIVNNAIVQNSLFRAALNYQFLLNRHWSWDIHLTASMDNTHYYNQLKSLLGGKYYLNYNSWVNDDGITNTFDYNSDNPNQKIAEGDLWGPNYRVHNFNTTSSAQIKFQETRIESSLSILYNTNNFYREGFNKNAQFKDRSIGKSALLSFNSIGIKYALLYKLSGRIYAKSNLFFIPDLPAMSDLYLDPNVQDGLSTFLQASRKQGIDFSFIYHGVPSKFQINFYWQKNKGQFGHSLFYHDYYNAFVYGIYGQMESSYTGAELYGDAELFSFLQVQAASTIGKYRITNNPLYEIKLMNDLYKVESGILQIKNLPASNGPEIVHSISLSAQPSFQTQVGLTAVYAMNRYIDYDFYRRSFRVVDKLTIKESQSILSIARAANQFTVNAFAYKSFNIKLKSSSMQVRCSINIKNCLNQKIPLFIFEQSRYDYIKHDPQKFPIKILYDQGLNCSFGIQFQIQ